MVSLASAVEISHLQPLDTDQNCEKRLKCLSRTFRFGALECAGDALQSPDPGRLRHSLPSVRTLYQLLDGVCPSEAAAWRDDWVCLACLLRDR